MLTKPHCRCERFHVFSVSRTLRDYVNDLLKMIDVAPENEEKRGVKREREGEEEVDP